MLHLPLLIGGIVSSLCDEPLASQCAVIALTIALVISGATQMVCRTGPETLEGAPIGGTRVSVLPAADPARSRFVFVFSTGVSVSMRGSARLSCVSALRLFGDVVLHERRGFGVLKHVQPSPQTIRDDMATALIVACSLNRGTPVLVGFSLGCVPALLLSHRHPDLPVILLAPFFDARTLDLPKPMALAAHLCALTNEPLVRSIQPGTRVLVMHSPEDRFIPQEHGLRVAAGLRDVGADVRFAPALGPHGDPVVLPEEVAAFLGAPEGPEGVR